MKVICPEVSRVYNCEFVISIIYCIHHYYIRGAVNGIQQILNSSWVVSGVESGPGNHDAA